jgi:hypothetical protein
MHTYIRIHTRTGTYIHIQKSENNDVALMPFGVHEDGQYVCICICICALCVCIYIHTHIHTHTHTHTYTYSKARIMMWLPCSFLYVMMAAPAVRIPLFFCHICLFVWEPACARSCNEKMHVFCVCAHAFCILCVRTCAVLCVRTCVCVPVFCNPCVFVYACVCVG